MQGDFACKEYENVDGLIGFLIANRLATLHELETVYTVEDAMKIHEAYIVPKYNEYMQQKKMTKKARK